MRTSGRAKLPEPSSKRLARLAARLAALLLAAAWMSERRALPRAHFDGGAFLAGVREAPDLSRFPIEDPHGRPWRLEPAFPGLELGEPVAAEPSPSGGGSLLVLEHEGRLWEVAAGEGAATKQQLLDLSGEVFHAHEAGAEGFALHPDFATRGAPGSGALFVFYVVERDGALYDRVSRFSRVDERFDREGERVLIEQRHDWQAPREWGEHFGGNLAFGRDGLLYVGFGDEGGHQEAANPQRIDRDLFSGILRIDPDCRSGRSHPPPRAPETGKTAGYCIPDDNPFVGEPGVLEEFWAFGLRNPWGLSFDPATGDLWVADVGKIDVEEVNRVVAGGNYQWSYREGGRGTGRAPPSPLRGIERGPIFTYPHGGGETSIVGGLVYRGARHPELAGRYVFGDHGSGRIRSVLAAAGEPVPAVEELAAVTPNRLLAFARDADGEVLVLARRPHGLLRLVRAEAVRGPAPERLSETGLFADVATRSPARGVLPYRVNVPAFADGARGRHWIALPGDGASERLEAVREHVVFRPEASWTVPAGSVLAHHLEIPGGDGAPAVPVETRLLVLPHGGSVYGLSYRWTSDGRDALRVDETIDGVVAAGGRERPWTFLGPETCATCHHAASGYVLGLRARQLAGEARLAGIPGRFDQLAAWSAAGLFTLNPWKRAPPGARELRVAPFRPLGDASASLEARARSYLDVNCAPCHVGVAASFSLAASTPTALLLDRPVRNDFGIERARLIAPGSPERSLLWVRLASDAPGIRMPPIGRATVDAAAVRLVGEWIRSLPSVSEPPATGRERQRASNESATSRGSPHTPL